MIGDAKNSRLRRCPSRSRRSRKWTDSAATANARPPVSSSHGTSATGSSTTVHGNGCQPTAALTASAASSTGSASRW